MKEKAMKRSVILLSVLGGFLFCCQVQAAEPDMDSGMHLGPVGQIKATSHGKFTDSLGIAGAFHLGDGAEMHTSAWINVVGSLGGGIGGGTVHHLNNHFLLGWEISAEYEREEGWFVGVGPVLEACATKEVYLFLKVPVGWNHTHHRDHLGWFVVAGVNVFLFH